MDSLFKTETAKKFIDRIHQLTPQTIALWGKMNASQMLTHCQVPLNVANGSLAPKISPIMRILFGKVAKKRLIIAPEFKKNLPTFKEAIITGARDFEKEKDKLIELIKSFQQNGAGGLKVEKHPFFGDMSSSDWDTLQVKHLDHHLRQFGV